MRHVATLASGAALALGLGEIRVKSQPGQPLLAEIPIISNEPGELEQLQAKAASAAGDDLSASAVDVKGVKANEISERAETWVENEMRRLFPHHYRDEAGTPPSEGEATTAADGN